MLRQRFAAEKGFIHEAAKQRNGRTNLKSTSPKVKGLGYFWVKLRRGECGESNWRQEKGEVSSFRTGASKLHASPRDARSVGGVLGLLTSKGH